MTGISHFSGRHLATALLSVALFTQCSTGGVITRNGADSNRALSFSNPPALHTTLDASAVDIWCTSLNGAQYMSITGWFSPDCTEGALPSDTFAVTDITSYEFGTVKTLVLYITDGEQMLWIPLPEHEWA